jgi:hypothetical protein
MTPRPHYTATHVKCEHSDVMCFEGGVSLSLFLSDVRWS